jgi:O-antigen/teichoic acid export membrane protein
VYAHALLFTVLGQVVLGVTRLAALAWLGRVAGKSALGETVALLALGTFLVLVAPQAIGAAASRYVSMASMSRSMGEQASVERATSRVALLSLAPLSVAATITARYGLGSGPAESLWAGVLPACLGAAAYARALRYGRMRFAQGLFWDCLGASGTLVGTLVVLSVGAPQHALFPFCLGYLISAVAGWPRRGEAPLLAPEREREIMRYAAWTAIQVVASGGLLQIVTWMAALRASPQSLGEFGAAVSIATPLLLLSIALRTSLTPFLARDVASGNLDSLNRATDLLMRGMVALFVPAFGLVCVWSPWILSGLFGEQYRGASDVLVILLLAVSVNCFNASHVWLGVALASGPKSLAVCNGAGLLVGTTVASLGDSGNATLWAAIGYLVGSLVAASLAAGLVWEHAGMQWGSLVARLLVGYALLLGAVAVSTDRGLFNLAVSVCFVTICGLLSSQDLRRINAGLRERHCG